jgi:hypothetical protein
MNYGKTNRTKIFHPIELRGAKTTNQERKTQMTSFKPNALTFEQGITRIKEAGFDFKSKITTSRDAAANEATRKLMVSNVPGGFKKFQLPLYMDKPSQLFVSIGAPDAEVPEHSHDEGDGIRYIVSGSIIYNGQELTAGDWMFIPAGMKYSLRVGPRGAHMFYCYQCCCA